MADYSVSVVNQAGDPVPGADVELEMLRHSYEFGTACQANQIAGKGYRIYRSKFLELFNSGTFYNDLKWPPMEGDWGGTFNTKTTVRYTTGIV